MLYRLINEEVSQIKQIQDHGRIRQIFEAPQDQGDLIKRYRRIDSLFRQLYVSPTIHMQWAALIFYRTTSIFGLGTL